MHVLPAEGTWIFRSGGAGLPYSQRSAFRAKWDTTLAQARKSLYAEARDVWGQSQNVHNLRVACIFYKKSCRFLQSSLSVETPLEPKLMRRQTLQFGIRCASCSHERCGRF